MKSSIFVLLTVLVLCPFLLQPASAQGTHGSFMKGGKLTNDEVQALEEELAAEPDNKAIRKKLLGYHFRTSLRNKADAKRKVEHILWFIENDPESKAFSTPYLKIHGRLNLEGYRKAANKWDEVLEQDPENADIIKSAANWFANDEPEKSVRLAEQGKELEPGDSSFPELLAQNYRHQVLFTKDEEKKSELAKKSFEELKIAFELSEPKKRGSMRGRMAKAAFAAGEFEDAKSFANQMLDDKSDNWNSGNNVHAGNNILGLIAIKSGDLQEAKRRLLAAGATKGSPQLNSFGPNMLLAEELLKHDQREVVLEYFELCREFWSRGGEKLDQWADEIDNGKIPKFGGNLLY